MSTKFTKGPWVVDPANPNLVAVDSDPYEYICEVCPGSFSISSHDADQEEANARLIAKAPELYEVLRQIVGLDKDSNPGLATWMEARCAADKTARALLAEIEGE